MKIKQTSFLQTGGAELGCKDSTNTILAPLFTEDISIEVHELISGTNYFPKKVLNFYEPENCKNSFILKENCMEVLRTGVAGKFNERGIAIPFEPNCNVRPSYFV